MRFLSFSVQWLLLIGLLAGCNAAHERKSDQPDASYDPTVSATDTTKAKPQEAATLVGQVVLAPEVSDAIQTKDVKKEDVRFEVKENLLLQRFIEEFGDGTVVDKVLITPIRDTPRDKPVYYLVGLGQLNGQFRAMALPLYLSAEKSLFLKPSAERYIVVGADCPMCYFDFSHGKITGANCDEKASGTADRRCTLKREPGNHFYPQALKQEPMGGKKK